MPVLFEDRNLCVWKQVGVRVKARAGGGQSGNLTASLEKMGYRGSRKREREGEREYVCELIEGRGEKEMEWKGRSVLGSDL